MFGRFFKNKDDSNKSLPPGHRTAQGDAAGAAGGAAPEPVGGGFFNLPPTVAKAPSSYATPSPAPSTTSTSSTSHTSGAGGASSHFGRPTSASSHHSSGSSYGAQQPPSYGQPQPSYGNHSAAPAAPGGGGMDMFGGMSLKAPAAAPSGYGGAPQQHKPSPVKYGGYGAHDSASAPAPAGSGSLFSGLDLAPGGAAAAPTYGSEDEIVRPAGERRKSGGSTGRAGTYNASSGADAQPVQRQSIGPGVGGITRPGAAKGVKKKKTKSFRPGFGRQLSDESAAALQRGDLNPEDLIQQQQQQQQQQQAQAAEEQSHAPPRMATNPTDLAHLLPPVKGGSVLAGLTVHDGGSSSAGGGVLAGLTVHGSSSPRGSSKSSPPPPEGGLLAGLQVHGRSGSEDSADASTSVVLPSSRSPAITAKKKTPPPEPEKPPAPLTPEEKLMNTLRDFHASAVSFRESALKQNEEENRILERKVQLAKQLTQYEIDLKTIEAQQQQACEVEDFEKADALNSTINSVRHRITLSESDVRKVDAELVAFVKAKEKAFTNQLRSTRGTLKELEKFREDQDAERNALREELKKFEVERTEHLQFEAERIEAELNHLTSNMDNLTSEKSEIEATIEDQCKNEITLREELLIEKAGVHEEIMELERQLKIKMEQMQGIQAAIDKAEKDIDTVRSRYSRQLKRIADREAGLLKTKTEVEADAEQLKGERKQFSESVHDYSVRIAAFGKRMAAVKKEMRAAMLLATVLEVQETRREQATIRKKQQTAELTALADSAAIAEQSFLMLRKQHEELEKSLSVHHNAIASADAMIPQLEQEKKAAAAQRNFKEAARISKDIKGLEKDKSTAEEMVEVVEMELQDLKERIEKREAEYEEKKEELKTVEKQLELNTLHELWKEAKSLRRSLRKFERVKNEGIAAADGVDFRSSALLLVQAEYDACIVQAEALESKYDLTDPAQDEEDEEDDEDDESADEEEDEESTAIVGAVDSDNRADLSGGHPNGGTMHNDFPQTVEEANAKIAELEDMIERATENEEYEIAAKLDEKLEALRVYHQSLQATAAASAKAVTPNGPANQTVIHAAARTEVDGRGDVTEEPDQDEDEGNSPEELEDELRLVRARIKMLEADIERDTENEDYEAAAALDEELQQLRAEEAEIAELLAESLSQADQLEGAVPRANSNAPLPVSESAADSGSGLFAGLGVNTSMTESTLVSGDSMFSGLQVTSSSENEEREHHSGDRAEVAHSEEVIVFAADSGSGLFAGLGVNTSAPESTLASGDSMFSGLQVTSSLVNEEREHHSDDGAEVAHSEEVIVSPKDATASPRRVSVGSGPNSPRRKSSLSMFTGLQVGSTTTESPRKSSITSDGGDGDGSSMFSGLQLGSSGSSHLESTSSTAESSMFDGLKIGSTEGTNVTTQVQTSGSVFVGLSVVEKSEDAAVSDDGVVVDAADTEDVKDTEVSSIFEGAAVKVSESTGEVTTEETVTTVKSVVGSASSDLFGGLSISSTTVKVEKTEVSLVESTTTIFSTTADATTSVDIFGGLSLAPATVVTEVIKTSAEDEGSSLVVAEPEAPKSPADMFGGLSLAQTPAVVDDAKKAEE